MEPTKQCELRLQQRDCAIQFPDDLCKTDLETHVCTRGTKQDDTLKSGTSTLWDCVHISQTTNPFSKRFSQNEPRTDVCFRRTLQLLHDQVGMVNFDAYKPLFLQTFSRARTCFQGLPSLQPLFGYPHRNW